MAQVIESIECRTISGLAHFKLLSFGKKLITIIRVWRVGKSIDACGIESSNYVLADKLLEIGDIFFIVKFGHFLS